MAGNPFEGTEIEIGRVLSAVPPEVFQMTFLIAFFVLVVHSFILSFTLKMMRGSHPYVTLLFFIPMVWIVAITSVGVEIFIGGFLEV